MSFLRPDNKPNQTDDVTAQATVDPFATPAPQPSDDGGVAPQTDDNQAAQNPTDPAQDAQATDANNSEDNDSSDVTVTTNEGSTLHTFNDPTLQNAAPQDAPVDESTDNTEAGGDDEDKMASGLAPDANGASNSVNDALSFQDSDGSALTSVGEAPTEPETVTESADTSTDGLPEGIATDDSFSQPVTSEVPSLASAEPNSELDSIKKQALEQLRPLLEKVDLPAGEKFDKYLMMLRATDDPTLIEPAFNAAQGITEEKDKAEALVDIINEINYVSGGEQTDEKPTE